MKKIFILTGIFLCLGILLYYVRYPLVSKVRIRNKIFVVDVAVTNVQKERGLGGKSDMHEDYGMLFTYDHKEQYEFWMKGMKFPLDFIWIEGNTVVDLTQNVLPPNGLEKPTIVTSSAPVDKVFEVNAGIIQKFGIQKGDRVEFLDR